MCLAVSRQRVPRSRSYYVCDMDPVSGMLPLGVAVAKLLLRWQNLNDTADALGDAHMGVSSLRRLLRSDVDPLGKAIAKELSRRLEFTDDAVQRADLNGAALAVASLLTEVAGSDEALLAAATSPGDFSAYVQRHGGHKLLARTEMHATPFAEKLITISCETFSDIAPKSPRFTSAALVRVLSDLPQIADDARRAADTAEEVRDLLLGPAFSHATWQVTGGLAAPHRVVVTFDETASARADCERWAQWVLWSLKEHGLPARLGRPAEDLNELIVAVGRTGPDPALSPINRSSGDGRTVSVFFNEDGSLADDGAPLEARAAQMWLAERIAPLVYGRVLAGRDGLRYDYSTHLPRLQRLSVQALHDAAQVGTHSFEDVEGEPSLYIIRDLESAVLHTLNQRSLVVVSGEAGSGKTSLLWGLAQRLLRGGPKQDVYFLKSSYLLASERGKPLVSTDDLLTTIKSRSAQAISTVLIDTADLLVSDERTFDLLMDLIYQAREADARVVVTSRPIEAQLITAGTDAPLVLGTFSRNATGEKGESEFERAVRAHALVYCTIPGNTSRLAQQLLLADVRSRPVGVLAESPLSLRMLFELYAPGLVPEAISPTDLFGRYWADRVVSDRRGWGDTGAQAHAPDLSAACQNAAAAMLRVGLPDVRVDDILLTSYGDAQTTRNELFLLCARGVGSMGTHGRFRFFHQAFFEYAASKLLLSRSGGMTLVANRASERPDDYFLAAVLEQAWILAWRDPEHAEEARVFTIEMLSTEGHSLQRVLLRVLAQVPLAEDLAPTLGSFLAQADLSIVKEYLNLIPRPGAEWHHDDTQMLAAVHSRAGNAARDVVVHVLERLGGADPDVAFEAVATLTKLSPRPFIDDEALDRGQLRDLLGLLATKRAREVVALLGRFGVGKSIARSPARLARVFESLQNCPGQDAHAVSQWADSVAPKRPTSGPLVAALKDLHVSTVEYQSRHHDSGSLPLDDFINALHTIEGGHGAGTSAAAWAWAYLDVYSAEEFSSEMLTALLVELFARDSPRLHEQIHHGWLCIPVNRSLEARRLCAQRLSRGLPANRRSPDGALQRWADTIRRTLIREDVEREALLEVLAEATEELGRRYAVESIWLDHDMLLWLVLIAAASGEESALRLLGKLREGVLKLDPREERVVVQQGQKLTDIRAGTSDVVEYLAARSGYVELFQLLERLPSLPWPAHLAGEVKRGLLRDCASGNRPERRRALRLLTSAVNKLRIPRPSWAELAGLMDWEDEPFRASLSDLLYDGARDEAYPWKGVGDILQEWWTSSQRAQPNRPRFNFVRVLSTCGSAATIDQAVQAAFADPVDGGTVSALAGFLTPRAGGHPCIPVERKVGLLIETGQRLADPAVPATSRRDVPGTWREILGMVLNHATDEQLCALAREATSMAEPFAERVLSRMPARRHPPLVDALRSVRDSPAAPQPLRRQASLRLQEAYTTTSVRWATFDLDFAESTRTTEK